MSTSASNAFDPALIAVLSRHAAACGIGKLIVRQGDFLVEMDVAVPDGPVPEGRTGLAADCAGILHWRHPDRADEETEEDGPVRVKAGEAFAYLEAGGLVLPQNAPAAGRGERLVQAGTLVGYGTLLMDLRTP